MKKPPPEEDGRYHAYLIKDSFTVFANCLDGTALQGFHAELFFRLVPRLYGNIGITFFIVARKVIRRRGTAGVAIDTLVVHIEFTPGVLGEFCRSISHFRQPPVDTGADKPPITSLAQEKHRLRAPGKDSLAP